MKKNDAIKRDSWKTMSHEELQTLLLAEIEETKNPDAKVKEWVDVANFCMMIYCNTVTTKDKDKDKIFITGSLESVGIVNEYERKCCFCNRTVFLANDWSDKKTAEFCCPECVQKGKVGKTGLKFIVAKQTVNSFNEAFGTTANAKDLSDLARKNLSPTRKQK